MFRNKKVVLLLVALFFTGILSGCTPKNNLKGGVPAKGKVTYKNQPLSGAWLSFVPPGDVPGKYGMGRTDEKGEFTMWTQERFDGVLPGEYRVAISKTSGGEPTISAEEIRRREEEDPDAGIPMSPLVREIPDKYFEAETSGFTVTIPSEGKTDILFELE